MFDCFKDKVFLKKFLKISLPVMISAFISFLVSFLDNIMVGTVSNEAVSAVYAANEVTFLFNLAAFGILEGAGIFIEQLMGAYDKERIKQAFRFKIVSSIIFLLVAIPIVYTCGRYLIYLFCYSDSNWNAILNEGIDYLNLIAISYIPFMVGYIYSTSLREIGETKHAMISSIIAIVVNVIFNYIFIMVFDYGVIGAAIATIIARSIEMLYLIIVSHVRRYCFCDGAFKGFKIEGDLAKKILSKGWLLFINEIGYSAGVVLQSLAFSQRDAVLSSVSIVSTISNVYTILINGLSVGIGVMVGQALGANDFKRAKEDNKKLQFLGVYASIFVGIVLISLNQVLPLMFTEVTKEQKDLASILIIIYASMLVPACLSVTSYFTLRVGGKTLLTFILDSGMMVLVYVPIAWILAGLTDIDMVYIYLIVRSLDIIKAIFGMILVKRGSWVRNLTTI